MFHKQSVFKLLVILSVVPVVYFLTSRKLNIIFPTSSIEKNELKTFVTSPSPMQKNELKTSVTSPSPIQKNEQKTSVTSSSPIQKDDVKTSVTSPSPIQKDDLKTFVISLGKSGKPVTMAVANHAYLPLAHSWLCNTEIMGLHDQLAIFVPDELSRQELKRQWPKVHTFAFSTMRGHIRDSMNHSTLGFQEITYFRAQVVKELLHMNLDVFLFEFDAVWFKSPISDFRAKLGTGDVAAVEVTGQPDQIGIGLLYIRATPKTKSLWKSITEQMLQLLTENEGETNNKHISLFLNDQYFLMGLVKPLSVQVVMLPVYDYADGQWYMTEKKNPNPVLINNNWIVGIPSKIERAKKFSHWFWDMKHQKCDFDLVRKTLKNFQKKSGT